MSKHNQEILDRLYTALRKGQTDALRVYYLDYKEEFYHFARKYCSDEEVIRDVYHDTYVILYENIVGGKLVSLKSSLKTYIFSIGKYSLFNHHRKKVKMDSINVIDENTYEEYTPDEEDELDDQILKIQQELKNMGSKCREILLLFYYKKQSIKSIMKAMGYKNENTVKAHKSRCMKQLRNKMAKASI